MTPPVTFLSASQHAELVAACERANVDVDVAAGILALAEEHAARQETFDLFKAGRITAVIGIGGYLRWQLTDARRAELEAERTTVERITASTVTDDQIRAVRDEARATFDLERARCCNAALGMPTGDGALGLLNASECRARIAAIVENARQCGTLARTYGEAAITKTDGAR